MGKLTEQDMAAIEAAVQKEVHDLIVERAKLALKRDRYGWVDGSTTRLIDAEIKRQVKVVLKESEGELKELVLAAIKRGIGGKITIDARFR